VSVPNPYVRSYQSAWLDDARNADLDMWFRVFALAYSRIRANGHAVFLKGEIAELLGKPDYAISQAIRLAEKKKLLDPSSNARCLVLPSHKVAGHIGSHKTPCPVHDALRAKRQKGPASATVTHPPKESL
jgi:hypothetical protein